MVVIPRGISHLRLRCLTRHSKKSNVDTFDSQLWLDDTLILLPVRINMPSDSPSTAPPKSNYLMGFKIFFLLGDKSTFAGFELIQGKSTFGVLCKGGW